jgi:polysaccharide deacetylase 2 family uncharacterized protein YibQ
VKFPKLFGRKSKKSAAGGFDILEDDDDEEDVDGLDDAPRTRVIDEEDEKPVPGSEFDDEEIEQLDIEPPVLNRRLSPFAIGLTVMIAVAVVGGFGWWLIETDSLHESVVGPKDTHTETSRGQEIRHVSFELPPRPPAGAAHKPTADSDEPLTPAETIKAIASMAQEEKGGVIVKPMQMAALNGLKPIEAQPLLRAPDMTLVEKTQIGPLPKIGTEGRQPWQVYARPFFDPNVSRLGIVITGIGMSRDATKAAITYLPADVTLCLDPYGTDLADWATEARQVGHEVLLGIPMDSVRFPVRDPGPFALLTSLTPAENQKRLRFLMTRFSGYTGVMTLMGSRFTTDERQMRPVLETFRRRGLLYIESQTTSNTLGARIASEYALPFEMVDIELDADPSREAIDKQLAEFERMARDNGGAIAVARPYPVTIERIVSWSRTLAQKKMALAPASGVVGRKYGR